MRTPRENTSGAVAEKNMTWDKMRPLSFPVVDVALLEPGAGARRKGRKGVRAFICRWEKGIRTMRRSRRR